MRRVFAALLVCAAAFCGAFALAEAEGEGFALAPGTYTVGGDVAPGWYRLSYVDGEYSSVYVYTADALPTDSVLSWWYCWYGGEFGDGEDYPVEAIPLLAGCRVVVGDMNDGRPDPDTGSVFFERLQAFGEGASGLPKATAPFTVGAGEYTAGTDFPVGAYSIEAAGDGAFNFVNYSIYDENGERILNGVLQSEAYAEWMREQLGEPISATSVGKIEFRNGWVYKAEVGSSRFRPYTGIRFGE